MFIRYNIHNLVDLYNKGNLSYFYLDHDGIKHMAKWQGIADLLININNRREELGMKRSRIIWSFIDRTRSTPSFVKTHIDDNQLIPLGKPKSLNILDICLDRADELFKTNKHINVLWSGGIDSTLVLFSLIRQARHIDQLSVVCTFDSVVESGSIFDSVIKDSGIRVKFDQTRSNCNHPYTYDNEDPTQLYVSGQCGDQLFGAPNFLKMPGIDDSDSWDSLYDRNVLDLIEPTLKFSERPIETIHDLRWWVMFNFGWTTVQYDDCIGRPPELARRINAFYATPEFQRWSIHTPTYYETPISYDDPVRYKVPLKKALSCLLDSPYYIRNKGKGISTIWKKDPYWYLLDKNFNTHYIDQ